MRNIMHHSIKVSPMETPWKLNEKTVFSNLPDKKKKHKPRINFGQIARTTDIKNVSSEGDSTN